MKVTAAPQSGRTTHVVAGPASSDWSVQASQSSPAGGTIVVRTFPTMASS